MLPEKNADEDPGKHHQLNVFLGTQDQFATELRKVFRTAPLFDSMVVDTIIFCSESIDSKKYLLAETKHAYLKAIAFGLFLLDGEGDEKDITKRKNIKLEKLSRMFRATPVVPLFGDSPITLSQIFSKAPNIGAGKWSIGEIDVNILEKSYNLTHTGSLVRAEYQDFAAKFKSTLNAVFTLLASNACLIQMDIRNSKNGLLLKEESEEIFVVYLQGLKFLSHVSTRVLEQTAFKYANPVKPGPSIPEDALSYEKAVRYNYTSEDKTALIEHVTVIKNLGNLLYSISKFHMDSIRFHIYRTYQEFAQQNISDYFFQAIKKKKGTVKYGVYN